MPEGAAADPPPRDDRVVSVLSLFDSILLTGYLDGRVLLSDLGGLSGVRPLELPGPPFHAQTGGLPAALVPGEPRPSVQRVAADTPADEIRSRWVCAEHPEPVVVAGGASSWPALQEAEARQSWSFDALTQR